MGQAEAAHPLFVGDMRPTRRSLVSVAAALIAAMMLLAASTAAAKGSHTVWLCQPGKANDPCTSSLTATVTPATGATSVQTAKPAHNPPVDCFYVYPTVSDQKTLNANLTIDPQEIAVAQQQASRFSQVCRVWAPMYPEVTITTLVQLMTGARPASDFVTGAKVAYAGALAAFRDYIAHFNHGRPFVLIGHSQGSSILIPLIQSQIDNNSALRRRMVSAIILGGNVVVPAGKAVGGDFLHVPACTSPTKTGCVIAYSSFSGAVPPPANALFGLASATFGGPAESKAPKGTPLQVLCTNPAALGGGTGPLLPYFMTTKFPGTIGAVSPPAPQAPTPWVSVPGLLTAHCAQVNNASYLQVDGPVTPGDPRPVVTVTGLGPTWGLHLIDFNVAIGNLVNVVKTEAAAYAHSHGKSKSKSKSKKGK